MRSIRVALLVGATATFAACGQERPPGEEALEPAPAPAPISPPTVAVDTTGPGLWRHLQESRYREEWDLFPGTTELYQGSDPHGALLTTYVNELARDALRDGQRVFPAGSIIVKENYMPDRTTHDGATVMAKVDGYAPEHGDWFWAKYDDGGNPEMVGRVEMCQACHAAARDRDYVITEPN